MTATRYEAPTPEGATEVSEWADVGTPGEFRCFSGAIRTIPEIRYSDDVPANVSVDGTQLADGRVEERYIRVTGVMGRHAHQRHGEETMRGDRSGC
jgi:hypothetical protein